MSVSCPKKCLLLSFSISLIFTCIPMAPWFQRELLIGCIAQICKIRIRKIHSPNVDSPDVVTSNGLLLRKVFGIYNCHCIVYFNVVNELASIYASFLIWLEVLSSFSAFWQHVFSWESIDYVFRINECLVFQVCSLSGIIKFIWHGW